MMKMVLLFTSILVCKSLSACRVSVLGNEEKLASADAVFEGVVVGVRLHYFEKALNGESSPDGELYFHVSDTTQPHTVSVFVTKVIKGNIEENKTIDVESYGCGVSEPQLRQMGKFHYFKNDGFAIPVYGKSFYDQSFE